MSPGARLRERADSYIADAASLREMGEQVWCNAFRAVADELRQVADEIEGE